ncbi:Ig-like domain-containing protein [Ruminiclostridium cellobioparum]|jgi:methionine-rich copper-binding protein CopC|uniref:Ig-like domain-containing protein n=1 Tax=Ruminiclostridium cellobioparum TaxID=29355 RepID=UPI0028ABF7FF|nr:Ig-like domain-containing protein [Ruminiclostridium cellobioparum]
MYKRRILTLIIICCCLISSFTATGVMAESNTQEYISENEMASRLSQLGMITGNEKGDYMLQSKLKRSEATQFLVNLIGKNKYVKDNKDTYSTTKFNDVKKADWFAPSVGYCEQSGIITVNDTATFRPKDYVSEKEFLGMTLKALGYTAEDFSWGTVFEKAYEIGLVDDSAYQTKTNDNVDFKRGNVVRVMYTALGLKPKSENISLIQKMVSEEVISYEIASASKIFKDEVVSQILEIKPLNEQKIKVIFNEKIGSVNPENIQINDTSNGNVLNIISSVSQNDTELIIKTSKQIAARRYSIEFKKFPDAEGNILPKVSGQFNGFTVVEVVSDLFKISKIEQKDEDEVNVYFTHPVNDNAANSSYYEIYDDDSQQFVSASPSDTSVKVLPNNKGVSIVLNTKKFKADQEYSIRVSPDVISAYGVNFVAQNELDTFIAKDIQQSTGFAIEQVIGLSRNTVQVDFTMEVDPNIAQQIFMYSLTDSNNKPIEVKAAQMVTNPGKSVLLTINGSLDSAKTYNLMVNLMSDAAHQYTINTKSYPFTGVVSGGIEFQVYSVTPVDTSSINVIFSKLISEKSISDLSNFTIIDPKNPAFKLTPIKAVVSSDDSYTVRLFLPIEKKLQQNMTYTLKMTSKVTDFTGYSLAGQYDYAFDTYNIPESSMSVEKAVKISHDTIKVVFNKEMAMDTPNILTGNYSVDYYENGILVKKVPIAITYIDSKIIVLKFDNLPDDKDCTFNYKQIKSAGGEVFSDPQKNTIKVTIAK